jgi:predicted nucleic acid-binding protein
MWLRKLISEVELQNSTMKLREIALTKLQTRSLLGRAYELRHNVGAYDAMYVALAEILQCPLITTDIRLANAPGVRCEIELLAA